MKFRWCEGLAQSECQWVTPGNPCWGGRLSTVDLLVLTSLNLLLFILKILFTFFYKTSLKEEVNGTELSRSFSVSRSHRPLWFLGGAVHRGPRAEAEVLAGVLSGPSSPQRRVAARVVAAATLPVSAGLVQPNADHTRVASVGLKAESSGWFILN